LFRFCYRAGILRGLIMLTFGDCAFRHFPKIFRGSLRAPPLTRNGGLGSRHSLNHTASRNTSEATARKRYVAGHGRCEYQRARVTTTIAPTKNRTRPVAAATPTRGTPMPYHESRRARGLEGAKREQPGLGPSPPRDVIDHRLGMAEVDDSRKDVSGNRHDRDNDIND